MKLWTVQNISAYERLKTTGVLRANDKFIWDDFKFQYNWMAEQMKNRIGLPIDKEINYPIWAWYQWNGLKKSKPDLRFSGHLMKGTKGIRIEFEVPDRSVLLSDFDDFNGVLNYGYISDNEAEYDTFYKKLSQYGYSHEDLFYKSSQSEVLNSFRSEVIRSWQNIFDLNIKDENWSGKREAQSIQATLWEVKWEQITNTKEFIAK